VTREAEKIAAEVLALPTSVRAFLAHRLISSLDEDADDGVEAAWMKVIDRRSEEIAQGRVICRPVSEVVRDIRRKLNASRRHPSRG
jgi:hypothetical protein